MEQLKNTLIKTIEEFQKASNDCEKEKEGYRIKNQGLLKKEQELREREEKIKALELTYGEISDVANYRQKAMDLHNKTRDERGEFLKEKSLFDDEKKRHAAIMDNERQLVQKKKKEYEDGINKLEEEKKVYKKKVTDEIMKNLVNKG
jgi:hypothetical protein